MPGEARANPGVCPHPASHDLPAYGGSLTRTPGLGNFEDERLPSHIPKIRKQHWAPEQPERALLSALSRIGFGFRHQVSRSPVLGRTCCTVPSSGSVRKCGTIDCKS